MFVADQVAGASRWPVVRVGSYGETEVVICGDRFLPLTVHWIGKSVPCGGDGCALCDVASARGLFYLPVAWDNRIALLELGARSSMDLEQHCKLFHAGIRPGLRMRLTKRGSKNPIHCEVHGVVENVQCVTLLKVAARVMALYKLPCPNPDEGFEAYGERVAALAAQRSVRLRREYEAGLEKGVRTR